MNPSKNCYWPALEATVEYARKHRIYPIMPVSVDGRNGMVLCDSEDNMICLWFLESRQSMPPVIDQERIAKSLPTPRSIKQGTVRVSPTFGMFKVVAHFTEAETIDPLDEYRLFEQQNETDENAANVCAIELAGLLLETERLGMPFIKNYKEVLDDFRKNHPDMDCREVEAEARRIAKDNRPYGTVSLIKVKEV